MSSIITADALTKEVSTGSDRLVILDHVSFAISAGESVAVVGASGSGKTTLLGLLAGLDTPTRGRVMLAGRDLGAMDEDGRARLRREAVGFVFQSFQLLPALTALENVMLPLELGGVAAARETAAALLGRVGLAARLRHYPRQLSGGQQQMIAVARAALLRPTLLLADEPTGALHSSQGELIMDLLCELNRDGITVVQVTHNPEYARRGQRVVEMRDGVLVG